MKSFTNRVAIRIGLNLLAIKNAPAQKHTERFKEQGQRFGKRGDDKAFRLC